MEASTSTSALDRVEQAFLEALSSKYFGSSELEEMWDALRSQATGPEHDQRLSYDGFVQALAACRARFGSPLELMLNPSCFLRLKRGRDGTVPLRLLFQLMVQRATLLNRRYQLACFDGDGDGYLQPSELKAFVLEVASQVPQISQFAYRLPLPQYAEMAARKLLFFHMARGRVSITELLESRHLSDLLAMADADLDSLAAAADAAALPWFSVHNLLALRDGFQELDKDADGRLTFEEFKCISMGTMSPLFLERVFERFCRTPPKASGGGSGSSSSIAGGGSRRRSSLGGSGGGGSSGGSGGEPYLDLLGFVDFMVAWEARATPAGVAVLFPALDLHQRGYITQAELYIFVKEIYALWLAFEQSADIQIMDILAEVMDILKPRDANRIRPADFLACGMPGTLLGMLGDVNLFWEYENREMLQQQQQHQFDADGDEIEVL